MNITCVGAWGRNYGDRAIQEGMRVALLGHDVTWFDIQGEHRHDIDAWNKQDMLVIGGGGLLWDKPELNSPSGWQFRLTLEEIASLTVPVVLYGLGWTQFPYHDRTGQGDVMRRNVTALYEKAIACSARNAFTADKLAEWGLDFDVVPDAAWLCTAAGGLDSGIWGGAGQKPRVALCWASDKPTWRWGKQGEEALRLIQVGNWLQKIGAFVVVVPHIEGMDDEVVDVLRSRNVIVRGAEQFRDLYPVAMNKVGALIDLYASADIVISMRKHGVILGAIGGKPTLAFGHMREPAEIAAEAGIPSAMDDPATKPRPICHRRLATMREEILEWMRFALSSAESL